MKHILLIILVSASFSANAQKPNWQNLDQRSDSVFGISTEKAYSELLKGRKAKKVLVAVIDSGVDTAHEDLKGKLWNNPGEKHNGQDDDKNGYPDDIHGWNFIGGKDSNVHYDNLELTRIIRQDQNFYDSLASDLVPVEYQKDYQTFRKIRKDFDRRLVAAQATVGGVQRFKETLDSMLALMQNKNPSVSDFNLYQPKNENQQKVKDEMINQLATYSDLSHFLKELNAFTNQFKEQVDYQLNLDYDPRSIVGDNYKDLKEQFYGNADVYGPHADHGTHVAGIIAAIRDNTIGIKGIAENAEIMVIRVVPDGDERDKDVANSIRYAVDNGAGIINMSFGKPFSRDKKIVDEAVEYAMQKDVLIIHAAGNDGKNIDNPENSFFPNKYYRNGRGEASAWLSVGASGWKDDSTLVAGFSNYGKTTVDVFAPGVQIYSTIPGSKYEHFDGTSMAAPMVSGLAALIRGYNPDLSAVQVRDIIMRSVVKVNHMVKVREGWQTISTPFSEICVSGGIINVYNALKLASGYKNDRK